MASIAAQNPRLQLRKSFENLGREISEKNNERRLIFIKATSRKFAAVFILISVVLGSQTFAVLRTLFPAKPEPALAAERS